LDKNEILKGKIIFDYLSTMLNLRGANQMLHVIKQHSVTVFSTAVSLTRSLNVDALNEKNR